jgi:uncharacterized protein YndB with AHSA1/START domain
MAIDNRALRRFPGMIIIIGLLSSATASVQDKQTNVQLVAKFGKDFVFNTAKVNGMTRHYVRGENDPMIINHLKMPNIRHELLIAAPAEKIYNALTSKEGLSAWWTPGVDSKPEVNSVARFPFGPNYFVEMKITELKTSRLVKWTCIKGVGEWVGTHLSFELIEGDKQMLTKLRPELQDQIDHQKNFDKGALLIFHQDDWKEYTSMYAECNYTWGQFLKSLKLFCETGKGRPWPNQHSIDQ